MKSQLAKYLAALAAIALLATPIAAQQGSMLRARAEQEIARTDEVLDRARDAVAQTKSTQAQVALDNAITLQTTAKQQFQGSNYGASLIATAKARELAQAALSAARNSEQSEDALRARLERTAELMEQVRESLAEVSDNDLQNLYQSTKANLDRAWEFYRSQQYRAALKLSNQVETAARKLMEAANRRARMGATYEKRVGGVQQIVDQTQELVADCSSEAAQQLLKRARQFLQLAQQLAGESKHEAALRALQTSQELALQAAQKCGGRKALEQRYERLRAQADKLAEQVDPGNDTEQSLLEQVKQQLDLARQHIDNGQYQGAVAALKAAQLTLEQLQRQLGQAGT